MRKLFRLYITDTKNLLRIKWVWLYLFFIVGGTTAFLYMSRDVTKVVLSLLNLTLLVVPLFSSVFSLSYLYDSRNFIELLLSQPVSRSQIFLGKFMSVGIMVAGFYVLGVCIPLFKDLFGSNAVLIYLLILSGCFLSLVFTSFAFLIGTVFDDRVKGVSLLLALWLYLSVIHDGLILFVIYLFKDYPLERVVLLLSLINPVDTARLLIILNLDIAALMGVTGVIFKEFLGSAMGSVVSGLSLFLWFFVPFIISLILFKRKDF